MKLLDFVSLNVGDIVVPTGDPRAGLWLADRPCTGKYEDKRENTIVLRGLAKVIKINDIEIDYDSWGGKYKESGIGIIPYRDLFVVNAAGTGWAGQGAVRRKNMEYALVEQIKRLIEESIRLRQYEKRNKNIVLSRNNKRSNRRRPRKRNILGILQKRS